TGARSLTARFDPTEIGLSPSTSSPHTLTVLPAATATALTSSAPAAVSGQSVTFTADVSVLAPGQGPATGTVVFTADGVSLGSAPLDAAGQATLTTTGLPVGQVTVTASYLPGPGFQASGASTA